ncbi:uncharacterized protein PAC_05190 [Phialocephala subalpina]|uniref:C2H2-type domain-containing protein n=1 Tax=Phialocephala subalpina TaxID=576137 RepID=A0A1L7WRA6_9HELO|nr:uncharacterized protein PAC_05190 [Phialocephala subalpina]
MDASTSSASASASSSFTCNACQAKFETNLQQRAHTKSDWHVYNLKRHFASLPLISAEVYNGQVLAIREESTTAEAIASSAFQKSCTICEKTFLNHTAYQNHFKSQGHAQEVARLEAKDDLSASMERITLESEEPTEASTSETVEFVPSKCLFCAFDSKSLDLNVTHMQKRHGLFIPDQEFLIDVETFLGYLSTVISQFHECLYCGSTKNSAEAARAHMMSKGHCKLNPEPGSEYEDFYEVASDIEDEDLDADAKEDKPKILVSDDNELHLPSGRTLGHRSQARYFRQRTPVRGKSTERLAIEDSTESGEGSEEQGEGSRNTSRQVAIRPARGEMGMVGVSELQKRALMAVEKKMIKAEVRAKNEYRAGLERLGNKQKFYRVSTLNVIDMSKH